MVLLSVWVGAMQRLFKFVSFLVAPTCSSFLNTKRKGLFFTLWHGGEIQLVRTQSAWARCLVASHAFCSWCYSCQVRMAAQIAATHCYLRGGQRRFCGSKTWEVYGWQDSVGEQKVTEAWRPWERTLNLQHWIYLLHHHLSVIDQILTHWSYTNSAPYSFSVPASNLIWEVGDAITEPDVVSITQSPGKHVAVGSWPLHLSLSCQGQGYSMEFPDPSWAPTHSVIGEK